MHFYPFHIGDYSSHTRNLTLMEDLAYRRLLDEYYLHERPFNGCLTDVAKQIGMRKHEAEIKYILDSFFELTESGWINHRANSTIQTYKLKKQQASKAGKASADKRLNGRSTDVQQTLNQPITSNQEPIPVITTKSKPIAESDKSLPAVEFIPLVDGSEWPVPESFAVDLEKSYPAVEMKQTLREIRAWNLANPKNRKTISGIKRHINQWFSKEQNRG